MPSDSEPPMADATPPREPTNSPPPDQNDGDDDDVVTARRSGAATGAAASDNDDLNDDEPPLEDEDDLFGDSGDDDAGEQAAAERALDDEELDSGDDLDGHGRVKSAGAEELEQQEQKVWELSLPRHPIPEPSDNEVYLMKLPRFLSVDPKSFVLEKWQPPTTDHHSKTEPSVTFSAFKTAQTTLRWRHSPSNPSQLQSNARILRWSDGSLTLQLGSDPTQQYELDGKPLAPPQHNPIKPTPTSIKDRRGGSTTYDPSRDSFTYLCSPHNNSQTVRITNKVTAGISVLPSRGTTDDALERLQESLAAAAKARSGTGATVFSLSEDPEKKKKEAELAEKERERAAKQQERANERRRIKEDRQYGRSGMGRSGGYGSYRGGLSAGGLEDEDRGARAPKARRPRRDEYSEDEEYADRRRTREDEYDEEDDFIAGSDEEPQVYEEEDIDDDMEERPARKDKASRGSPKRSRRNEDADEDAEDDEVIAATARKRRRVVEEEDDDEE